MGDILNNQDYASALALYESAVQAASNAGVTGAPTTLFDVDLLQAPAPSGSDYVITPFNFQEILLTVELFEQEKSRLLESWYGVLRREGIFDARVTLIDGIFGRLPADIHNFLYMLFHDGFHANSGAKRTSFAEGVGYQLVTANSTFWLDTQGIPQAVSAEQPTLRIIVTSPSFLSTTTINVEARLSPPGDASEILWEIVPTNEVSGNVININPVDRRGASISFQTIFTGSVDL